MYIYYCTVKLRYSIVETRTKARKNFFFWIRNVLEWYLDWNPHIGPSLPMWGCPMVSDTVCSKVSTQETCRLWFVVSVQLCVGSVSSVTQLCLLGSCSQSRQWHLQSGHLWILLREEQKMAIKKVDVLSPQRQNLTFEDLRKRRKKLIYLHILFQTVLLVTLLSLL